ncbi:aromatic amino acid lyase [Streptomyces diastatochromogenes]|uniref:aromatic amino acid lyase n=1 Tax=Streptomyces diastatochromogenes TaxID=42236 RepID=UPI0036840C9F
MDPTTRVPPEAGDTRVVLDGTGLPAFLASGPAGSSGTMILEYTANSAPAEVRSCAAPASSGHAVLSHGLEETAAFAVAAAVLPPGTEDRPLTGDITTATDLMEQLAEL